MFYPRCVRLAWLELKSVVDLQAAVRSPADYSKLVFEDSSSNSFPRLTEFRLLTAKIVMHRRMKEHNYETPKTDTRYFAAD